MNRTPVIPAKRAACSIEEQKVDAGPFLSTAGCVDPQSGAAASCYWTDPAIGESRSSTTRATAGGAAGEGVRLHALRTEMVAGAVVGDDTFPLIVGVALLLLGGAAVFVRLPSAKVTIPRGTVRARMLWALALLTTYWLIVPPVGYTASTALVSVGLFRAMGGYRWRGALLLGAVTRA